MNGGRKWRSWPVLAWILGVVTALLPIIAAVAVAIALASLLPPGSPPALAWAAITLIVIACVGVAVAARLVMLRLLPIPALLRLSLRFPDRAPSRFRVLRDALSPRILDDLAEEVRHSEHTPSERARSILTLMVGLGHHHLASRGHSERVRLYAELIGEELDLDEGELERLRWSALLHDVGKMETPPAILDKRSELDDHEATLIRSHPLVGDRLIAPLHAWLGDWGAVAREHHERWDGQGYPFGLAGEEISLGARIVAVADAYETMTAGRPYAAARTPLAAREEIAAMSGSQFDPLVASALLRVSLGRLWWTIGPLGALTALPGVHTLRRANPNASAALAGILTGTLAAAALVGPPSTSRGPLPANPLDIQIAADLPELGLAAPQPSDSAGESTSGGNATDGVAGDQVGDASGVDTTDSGVGDPSGPGLGDTGADDLPVPNPQPSGPPPVDPFLAAGQNDDGTRSTSQVASGTATAPVAPPPAQPPAGPAPAAPQPEQPPAVIPVVAPVEPEPVPVTPPVVPAPPVVTPPAVPVAPVVTPPVVVPIKAPPLDPTPPPTPVSVPPPSTPPVVTPPAPAPAAPAPPPAPAAPATPSAKDVKAALKAAEKAAKEAAKQAEQAAKQVEKNAKEAAKNAEQNAKEAAKAAKEAAKQTEKAAKEAEKAKKDAKKDAKNDNNNNNNNNDDNNNNNND